MRYIVLFAAMMALLTTHARARGAEFTVRNNCPTFTVVNNCPKAERIRPATKPALNIDHDHRCDRCGSYSNIVSQQANGMHSHVCTNPACRHEWWHPDPGAAPVQSYTLPASGCVNGNCPTSRTVPTRWRLFR